MKMKRGNRIKCCPNNFTLLLCCMLYYPHVNNNSHIMFDAMAGNKNQYMQYPQTVAIELESMVNSDYISSVVDFFLFSLSFFYGLFIYYQLFWPYVLAVPCSHHSRFYSSWRFSLKPDNECKGTKV